MSAKAIPRAMRALLPALDPKPGIGDHKGDPTGDCD
jgi:hypothetical protein